MLLTIDPASTVPLFEQLVAGIRRAIVGGDLAAGERLPAARELADSLDINVHTVLRAYQAARDEGLIELRRGRGAVVRSSVRDYTELNAAVAAVVAAARTHDLEPDALAAMIREAYR